MGTEDPLFDDKIRRKTVRPPSSEDIADAAAAIEKQSWRTRHSRHPIAQPFRVLPLSRVEKVLKPKPEKIVLFPNAEQLGREAEQAVYATMLWKWWTKTSVTDGLMSRQDARTGALVHFMGHHHNKAFAIGDSIIRLGGELAKSHETEDVLTAFFDDFHNRLNGTQLGLGVETVIKNPAGVRVDLRQFAPAIDRVAHEATKLYFEQSVAVFFDGRIIVAHPFDVVYVDRENKPHIIELSLSHRDPYHNDGHLVEAALVQLAANRITVGQYDEQIFLDGMQKYIGTGEFWCINDRSPFEIVLAQDHLNRAKTLIQHVAYA